MASIFLKTDSHDGAAEGLCCLRALLCGLPTSDSAEVAQQAMSELVASLQGPLFHYCEGLLRCSNETPSAGAYDNAHALALTAWNRTLEQLAGPQGDTVTSAVQLWRITRAEAKRAWLETAAGQAALTAAAAADQEEFPHEQRTLGRRPKIRPCPISHPEPTRSPSPPLGALPGTCPAY